MNLDPIGFPGQVSFVHKRIGRAIGGFVRGGPIGALAGFANVGGGGRPPPPPRMIGPGISRFTVDPLAIVPGGRPFISGANGAGQAVASGFHLNKSDYFLRDGTFVAKGTRMVKNRTRNPMNPRALKRAVARINAGKRWQGMLAEISTGKFTAAGNKKSC